MSSCDVGGVVLKVLFIGDIIGEPGRKMVRANMRGLMETHRPDLVIANGENAAGGFGITSEIAEELLSLGIHVLTSGNHVWDKKEIEPYLTKQDRLIRPANYPDGNPGYGSVVISTGERQGRGAEPRRPGLHVEPGRPLPRRRYARLKS